MQNYVTDVFVFLAPISTMIGTRFACYALCKHLKLKFLGGSIALHQGNSVNVISVEEDDVMNG